MPLLSSGHIKAATRGAVALHSQGLLAKVIKEYVCLAIGSVNPFFSSLSPGVQPSAIPLLLTVVKKGTEYTMNELQNLINEYCQEIGE